MSYTRPSSYPDFCLTGTRAQPSTPLTNTGYVPDDIPDPTNHNFLFGTMGDWVRWLDQQQQAAGIQQSYDAIVGSGLSGSGTFADINALMVYMAANPSSGIVRVLVVGAMTLAATQVINQSGMEFDFKANAVWTKAGSTTPALDIQADRVTIRGCGRFVGFSGGSDVAIQIESGNKNNQITGQRFNTCTTAINDLGTNNSLFGNIEEA